MMLHLNLGPAFVLTLLALLLEGADYNPLDSTTSGTGSQRPLLLLQ